jgi:hypothetical protein
MAKQLAVYITGAGTRNEILLELEKIVHSLQTTSVEKLAKGVEWEGPTLMTEIEEYEPR